MQLSINPLITIARILFFRRGKGTHKTAWSGNLARNQALNEFILGSDPNHRPNYKQICAELYELLIQQLYI